MSEFAHRFRPSYVLSFAFLVPVGLMVLTLVGCAGSASKAATPVTPVTVTAPAPSFISIAPTVALEGASYSYVLIATDPSGAKDVTFALTSSPADATLSGSTISWTPTSSESRVNNAFTVTAITAAGGTNTQSWTVNPNGTIRGSQIDTYWGANGSTTNADDLSGYTFSALVPNADGTYTNIAGTGNSDGTFTIPGVPAGNYWLTYNDPWNDGPWSFWTNSSTFDIGMDFTGRNMSSVTCDNTAALALNLTGLDSIASDYSYLDVTVPNQQLVVPGIEIAPGSPTSFVWSLNLGCPIDPTAGDVTYIVQSEPVTGLGGSYVPGPSLPLPNLAAPADSTPTNVTGVLATANPQSLDLQIQGAAWAADFTNVGSGVIPPEYAEVGVGVQPFVSDRAASGPIWLAYVDLSQDLSSTVDAGTVTYNNPYPSTWLQVFSGFAQASILDSYGGDYVENYYTTATAQPSGFAPLMSGVQNPMMNGASLFTTASSATDTVRLSWTAPTGLTPAGYEIDFYCVDSACPNNGLGSVYTASTSVTLPPGLLTAGYDYEFDIGAIADSRANFNRSPYRSGYPQAYADVISAPLYINPSPASAFIRGQAAAARVANKNAIRTKYGSFLVTARGNKPLDIKARMLARFNEHSLKASQAGPVK